MDSGRAIELVGGKWDGERVVGILDSTTEYTRMEFTGIIPAIMGAKADDRATVYQFQGDTRDDGTRVFQIVRTEPVLRLSLRCRAELLGAVSEHILVPDVGNEPSLAGSLRRSGTGGRA